MKPKAHWKPLVQAFKTDVHDQSAAIDPEEEHDWYSLTIGWALGKGLKPADAIDFAIYIRYDTDLG